MDLKFKDNSKLKLATFTQLEYIESTGSLYINTGIKVKSTHTVEATLQGIGNYSSLGTSHALFGGRNYGTNSVCAEALFTEETKLRIDRNSAVDIYINMKWGTKIIYKATPTQVIVNGITTNLNCPSGKLLQTYVICTIQMSGNSLNFTPYSRERIYGFKISENDVIILNLIPAKDNNNVVCLYDTVSKAFFYNQGTGDFVAGPGILTVPGNISTKTTTLYHKNIPNVSGLQLLNSIFNYQKTHQDKVKEYYYPTTQLWQDIITKYPDILYWYNLNHKLCIYICGSDNPEQFAENFLQIIEDYPNLIPIIVENPSLASVIINYPSFAPIIVENPEVIHSLVDTGYETWLNNNGTAYLVTQLSFSQGIRLTGSFYFTQLASGRFISIAGTYNGKHNLLRVNNQGPVLQVCINSNTTSTNKLEYSISFNTKYDLDLSNRASAYIKVNGLTVASANFSGDIAPTPIAIFAITKYDGSSDMEIGTLKSSAIKLYDINDNVVLWLAPIQNKNNPCMIDLLTGTKYLNQGAGSFTYSLEPKNA